MRKLLFLCLLSAIIFAAGAESSDVILEQYGDVYMISNGIINYTLDTCSVPYPSSNIRYWNSSSDAWSDDFPYFYRSTVSGAAQNIECKIVINTTDLVVINRTNSVNHTILISMSRGFPLLRFDTELANVSSGEEAAFSPYDVDFRDNWRVMYYGYNSTFYNLSADFNDNYLSANSLEDNFAVMWSKAENVSFVFGVQYKQTGLKALGGQNNIGTTLFRPLGNAYPEDYFSHNNSYMLIVLPDLPTGVGSKDSNGNGIPDSIDNKTLSFTYWGKTWATPVSEIMANYALSKISNMTTELLTTGCSIHNETFTWSKLTNDWSITSQFLVPYPNASSYYHANIQPDVWISGQDLYPAATTGTTQYGSTWYANDNDYCLADCAKLTTHPESLHISIYNESQKNPLVADLDAAFDITLDNGSTRYIGLDLNNNDEYGICIYPPNSTFQVDSLMRYFADFYGTRPYIITNATFNNVSQSINLYLLHASLYEAVLVEVKDYTGAAKTNVTVKALRFYEDTNSYETVEVTRTDSSGETQMYLQPDVIWYVFIIEENGEVIFQSDPQKIITTPITLTIPSDTSGGVYQTIFGLLFNVTFNETSGIVRFALSDPSNVATFGCVDVNSVAITGETNVNDSCSSGAAFIITVNASPTTNTVFVVRALTTIGGLNYTIWTQYYDFLNSGTGDYGTDGVVFTFLLVGTAALIGLANPTAMIILPIFALIASSLMGWIILPAPVLVTLGSLAVITIYLTRRNG